MNNRIITINFPRKIVFGSGSINNFFSDFLNLGYRSLFILTNPQVLELIYPKLHILKSSGIKVVVDDSITKEPTVGMFLSLLQRAREVSVDSVVGIGGGSVMDVAKLVSALLNNEQSIYDVFGINLLSKRETYLVCIPTTSGTGSEVSPNAVLLDERNSVKMAVISSHLLPDAIYVDPELTLSLPPFYTAITGIDALTHCIEAYINKFAHFLVDIFALEGIRLISRNLKRAFDNGDDLEVREKLSLGSLLGGLCLGPVNTAAVHALAYPLGGRYNLPHGLTVAVLLPYVMKYNLSAVPNRFKDVAVALGVESGGDDYEMGMKGINKIFELLKQLNLPTRLSELGIKREEIPAIAEEAMGVGRLLKNNPREVRVEDAIEIYNDAF